MIKYKILLSALVIFSFLSILMPNILTAAVMLGAASIVLTLILFKLYAPWAAVFELSVCAGLITVLFISAISLVRRNPKKPKNTENPEQEESQSIDRFFAESGFQFYFLPIIAAIIGLFAWMLLSSNAMSGLALIHRDCPDMGYMLWNMRTADILGQLCIFIAGVLAITAFFPKKRSKT